MLLAVDGIGLVEVGGFVLLREGGSWVRNTHYSFNFVERTLVFIFYAHQIEVMRPGKALRNR